MFGKKQRKVSVNATNSYLVEIARAILAERFNTSIYLTQINITSEPETRSFPTARQYRKYAHAELNVILEAFFTSIDSERRHGMEGVLPVLPRVKILFNLTNEASGWYNWRILFAHVKIANAYPPTPSGYYGYVFEEENRTHPGGIEASAEIRNLAKELEQRRPSSFKGDE